MNNKLYGFHLLYEKYLKNPKNGLYLLGSNGKEYFTNYLKDEEIFYLKTCKRRYVKCWVWDNVVTAVSLVLYRENISNKLYKK